MREKLLVLFLFTTIFSSKVFAEGFGLGGTFSVNSDMDTLNSRRIGLSGGLTLGFGEKEKPVIWDILMGSRSHLPFSQSVFTTETRIDFQIFNYSPITSFTLFIGPGIAVGMGVEWPNILEIHNTGSIPVKVTGSFEFHAVARLVTGMKFFAGRHLEFFLQVAPQIGWQFLASGTYVSRTDPSFSIVRNAFYWSIEASTGIRFWA